MIFGMQGANELS